MEPRQYPKPNRKPQPKPGMLVAALCWKFLEEDAARLTRRQNNSEYVSSIIHVTSLSPIGIFDEPRATWIVKTVPAGTLGIVIKGDGRGMFLVAFGGATGWVEVCDIGPAEWVQQEFDRKLKGLKP